MIAAPMAAITASCQPAPGLACLVAKTSRVVSAGRLYECTKVVGRRGLSSLPADRLARYLTVMSIVAWRLFMITLIARTDPATPCLTPLADHEWKVLFLKAKKNTTLPKKPPRTGDVVIWVAKLGGYLAKKTMGLREPSPCGEDGSDLQA